MNKRLYFLFATLLLVSMVLAACPSSQPAAEPAAEPAAPAAAPTEAPAAEAKLRVGMVSDVGGIDDASFNENTWKGLQDAAELLGVEAQFLESQAQADYEPNIIEFAEQGYDMIITVGFLLGDATYKMAAQYPDVKFAIVDYPSDPSLPNLKGILFNVDEASLPVGYVAAAMADQLDPADPQVGYIGGMQIPPVEQFIVAYEQGVKLYNEKYGKDVKFTGVYVGDFEAPDQGKTQGNSLIDEGVDVVMGVGGKTGNGGIAAAKERGKLGIGVDVDQYLTLPNEKDILVTSTIKRLDKAVFSVIQEAVDGAFAGGDNYIATLANEGVGVGPFHDFEDQVPDTIKADLVEIQQQIIAGELYTGWPIGQEPAEEPAPEATAEPAEEVSGIGSEAEPIKVLFVPSVDAGVIVSGGEVMAAALKEATGLNFEVSVPTSYAATVEAMCASPTDTIGFIPALGYVIANQKCGVEVGGAAVRFGWPTYWAQFLVQRDSDIQSLEDLAGKKWAIPDLGSTSGYLYPSVMFQEMGIEPGEVIETGGHPQAALAVYNGEVDFATTYFSPPLSDPAWQPGDDPEPFDPMAVALNEQGRAFSGDTRVLDARVATLETAPDMFEKVKILALTDPIPNDTMSFSPQFPEALRAEILDAMVAFTASEACLESICSDQFYNWTGIDPISDASYDVIRLLIKGLGYTEEDIFGG